METLILDPASVALVIGAFALGSFAKGVTGIGLPILAIPLIAAVKGVEHAVVVLVLPTLVSNLWLIWAHRRRLPETRPLVPFFAFGIAGGIAGTWLLARLDDRLLTLALAAWLAAYLLLLVLRVDLRLPPSRTLGPGFGLVSGLAQGATGISAPVIAPYLSGLGLVKETFVLAIALAFTLLSLGQIGAMIHYDLFTSERVLQGLVAILPVAVFLPLGVRWARGISGRAFQTVLIAVLVAMEVRLLYTGLAG